MNEITNKNRTPFLIAAFMAGMALALAAPAIAAAADLYVDAQTGDDANACTLAAPCATIGAAIAASEPNDRVLVDNGSYAETVTLAEGRSLVAENFVAADGDGKPVLDGGAGAAVVVPESGAGLIQGFVIRGDASPQVSLTGAAEVRGNTFDDPDATGSVVSVQTAGVGTIIEDNNFNDPAPSETRGRLGIYVPSGSATIGGNTFARLMIGVHASKPSAGRVTTIARNEITALHNWPVQGRGIMVSGAGAGDVIVSENRVAGAINSNVIGIQPGAGTRLVRNEVTGVHTGVSVGAGVTGASMDGDRIWGTTGDGVRLFALADETRPSLSARNVTVWGTTGVSFRVENGDLTVDSAIAQAIGFNEAATCTVSNSRANELYTAGNSPTGCDGFQTSADPMLADPANGDLHLLAGSPMIDAGDPAEPEAGAIDFDGDARAIDGIVDCEDAPRRDIGADEFVPTDPAVDCTPPETQWVRTPPKRSKKKIARFRFTADEPATFECKLDARKRKACESPLRLRVKRGRHVLRVWAIDAAGNADPTPARYAFRRARR